MAAALAQRTRSAGAPQYWESTKECAADVHPPVLYCQPLSLRVVVVVVALLVTACGSPVSPGAPALVPAPPPLYAGPAITLRGQAAGPQPTVILLALDAEGSWRPPFSTIADHLVARGWLGVTLDLPAHGADVRAGENPDPMQALPSWASRIAAGNDLVGDFTATLRAVVDGLTASQMSSRVVVVGISRGALLAIHAAASDSRLSALAIFIPVTDLAALDEFQALTTHPLVTGTAAIRLAPRFHTPLFIETSQTDIRVDADRALAFAARVRGPVMLHVEPTSLHTLPQRAMREAADWLARQR